MTAYAVAHMREVDFGPAVVEYLERIDATLDPFGGRFLVHGAEVEVVEGSWPGHLIVIAFPDRASVRAWYDSPAYREILELRTGHSSSDAVFVDGVGPGYRAATAVEH